MSVLYSTEVAIHAPKIAAKFLSKLNPSYSPQVTAKLTARLSITINEVSAKLFNEAVISKGHHLDSNVIGKGNMVDMLK